MASPSMTLHTDTINEILNYLRTRKRLPDDAKTFADGLVAFCPRITIIGVPSTSTAAAGAGTSSAAPSGFVAPSGQVAAMTRKRSLSDGDTPTPQPPAKRRYADVAFRGRPDSGQRPGPSGAPAAANAAANASASSGAPSSASSAQGLNEAPLPSVIMPPLRRIINLVTRRHFVVRRTGNRMIRVALHRLQDAMDQHRLNINHSQELADPQRVCYSVCPTRICQ